MTNSAFGDAAAKRKVAGRHASVTSEVADLIRHCSNIDGRHGFRVIAKGLSGHIFFERGHVIHAEFGEDCGLRAVVEMLRAGTVQLEPASSWPSQPRLHLGPELLLSLTGRDSSRVVRKVDLPMVGPPPLPDPQLANPQLADPQLADPQLADPQLADPQLATPERVDRAGVAAPVHSEAQRGSGKRAISGVMPRLVAQANVHPVKVEPAKVPPARDELARRAPPDRLAPSSSASEQGSKATDLARRRAPTLGASRLAAPMAVSERSMARAPGLSSPPPPPVGARPAVTPIPTGVISTRVISTAVTSTAREQSGSTALPITPVSTERSRSSGIGSAPSARSSSVRPSAPAGSARGLPKPRRDAGLVPPALGAAKSATVSPVPPTTMVRIAVRGDLLAARGKNAEQLAEAAAFIHGVASLIAADFGRHRHANVHLCGRGSSLLVARSEVNDIAAALGPTERLTSLLGKVGFK